MLADVQAAAAGRAPGTRSTGPCAAVPERTDTTDDRAARSSSVEAAGLRNAGRPHSEVARNNAPMMARATVHNLRMEWSEIHEDNS